MSITKLLKPANNIYVRCQGVDNEFVIVSESDLPENPYDLVYLLKLETAPRSCWRDVAAAYFRAEKWDAAITVLEQATSDDVENVLRGGVDDEQTPTDATAFCSRLDLLAALGGAYIMLAEASVHDAPRRKDALRKAADVFSRADKIDLDDPSIWTARGWSEFHAGKSGAVNWFDNARDKNVVCGAVGLAAVHLNRSKPSEPSRKDPVTLLVNALRSDVCPPGVWTGLAYALYKEGHIQSARNVARRALAALSKSPPEERLEALYILAMVELADKSDSSVEAMIMVLHEAYVKCGGDQDARILTLLANLYFNGGDFEKAEHFAVRATEAADLLPSLSVGTLFSGIQNLAKMDALFQLARTQHHLGKNDDAMRAFVQIKKMGDSSEALQAKINPGVYLRLGLLKLATGRKDDESMAKECLQKTLKLSNDRNSTAKRALGVLIGRDVLMGLKKGRPRGGEAYERAVTLLEKGMEALKVDECDIPAQLVYAGLIEEYYPRKALDSYRKVLKVFAEKDELVEDEIWNNYASLLARSGDVTEAREIYSTKVDTKFIEECASAAYNHGRLAELSGQHDKAEEIFRAFPKTHVHYFESIVRLAVIAMRTPKRHEEAERLLKEAKEAPLTRTTAIVNLSSLYASQKNYKQAQEVLEVSRNECDYLSLLFSSFMHRFLDSLDQERRSRFLINHIGAPLVSILKRNSHNACAANGVGVYFAESKMLGEARDAFTTAGSGPLADRVCRVNLAHIQVQMGIRDLKESAKITGRPSLRARSASRALFEQSNKLYVDAVTATGAKLTHVELTPYCELQLYAAWAQFESRDFRRCAHTLGRVLHMIPSCYIGWLNLAQALMESAMERVGSGTDRLDELQLARDEFEGSRAAIQKFTLWKRQNPDAIGRIQVSSRLAYELGVFVRQEAKSHDVKLRNAINKEEDRKEKIAVKTRELEAHAERQMEKKRQKEEEKQRKETELHHAFAESQRRQRENEENNQRLLAAKKTVVADDDMSGEDDAGIGGSERKSKSKRKRKDGGADDDKESKKTKRVRKAAVKKAQSDGSGDEYPDTPEEDDVVMQDAGARPDSKKRGLPNVRDDEDGGSEDRKRAKFDSAEGVSDESDGGRKRHLRDVGDDDGKGSGDGKRRKIGKVDYRSDESSPRARGGDESGGDGRVHGAGDKESP